MDQEPYLAAYYQYQTKARGLLDRQSLQKAFARHARWYHCRLSRYLPRDRDAVCLDVPCGYGGFLSFLMGEGYRNIEGYDLDPEQVRLARLLDLPAYQGEARQLLDGSSRQYDLIASVDFLEHLARNDALQFLQGCRDRLRPGGVLMVRVPCADGPFGAHDAANDLTHQWSLSSNVLRTILRMLRFERIEILDESPQPYNWINCLRRIAYHLARLVASGLAWAIGLQPPAIWSRSMWGVAYKPARAGEAVDLHPVRPVWDTAGQQARRAV